MTLQEIKEKLSRNKALLEEKYNVKSIGIFGSFAKDTFDRNSDIDILVEFSKTPDIFEFIRLEEFLSKLLGLKVDLVTRKALKPLIKDTILRETIYI